MSPRAVVEGTMKYYKIASIYDGEYRVYFVKPERVQEALDFSKEIQEKIIFQSMIEFDDEFVDKVRQARKVCRSFNEFAFEIRKQYRQQIKQQLGENDRNKIDFIKWMLASR